MGTPTNARSEGPSSHVGETVVTYSRPDSAGETEEEQVADYGDSDGGDTRRLVRPKNPSVIYMRRARVALPTGKSLEDKMKRRTPPKRKVREEDNSPRQRKKRREEIQKSIDKRKAASKRRRSIEWLNRRTPFLEVKTWEVSVKEIQAEKERLGKS